MVSEKEKRRTSIVRERVERRVIETFSQKSLQWVDHAFSICGYMSKKKNMENHLVYFVIDAKVL